MDTQLNWLDMPLPEAPPLKRMVRRGAPRTAVAAAEAIRPGVSALQQQVLDALDEFVQLTDEQLESLPCFEHLAPSTVRKRRSELLQAGKIRQVGETTNSRGRRMLVWAAA